ncbi:MAG: hypothetical protein DKM22_07695 [Candidatus Melainabacteria bacterium]|nr:MAG: hypothetical protein DKM22_07695 [Candidatus Melainabacteria bacterium]
MAKNTIVKNNNILDILPNLLIFYIISYQNLWYHLDMKNLVIISIIFLNCFLTCFGAEVFSQNNKFGLKDNEGNIIVEPQYTKMIKLGENTKIVQKKKKYGIIDCSGKIIVPIVFSHAERHSSYVKLKKSDKYGIFDLEGKELLPVEYKSINPLSDNMLLTLKDYKYGVSDLNGNIILKNIFDDIYMTESKIMRIQYKGNWYEIEQTSQRTLVLPPDVRNIKENKDYEIRSYNVENTIGYSAVTFTDYLIKIFSSISPAHEKTIDELILSHGAETVSILIQMSWIPKYPWTFIKQYYSTIRTPNNGPLSPLKDKLKAKK